VSQENVELVRRVFRAFNDRDLDRLLAMYADDVEWRLIGGFAALTGDYVRGRDALRMSLMDWIDNLGGSTEIEKMVEAGDRVLVLFSAAGAGRASGAAVTQRFAQVYTIDDGQISAVDSYSEPTEALKAAGLSE
jgi:ketosteroid isomerase-like protein